MNGCQFGFGSSALRGKIESGGGLCVSLPVEMSARHSKTASMLRIYRQEGVNVRIPKLARERRTSGRCGGTAALAGISSGTHQEYVDGEVI